MARCLIGCGSNLGKRREQLDRAVELLRFMPGVTLQAVSRFRETLPVGGPEGQGAYLNGACLLETDLPPQDVLDMLLAVENTLLRERRERWGERTVDLDLLLYDDLVVDSPALTLPHPRMATRRFVLEPCVEIAGELAFPVAACTLRDLLDNISVPHPFVAVVGVPGSGAAEVAAAVADATVSRLVTAPSPLPAADTDASAWEATLDAWAQPLHAGDWELEPHGVVADFWLDALPLAAVGDLPAAAHERFDRVCRRIAATAVAPHVAILLVTDAATIAARLAAEGTSPAGETDRLMRIQERLVRRLRCPGERAPRAPKAVVPIDARDLGRAVAEATAAVEAML
jgi:2-amino-4-hydroxy-6-hydroxymethyldihydropteridine diphosphokinase